MAAALQHRSLLLLVSRLAKLCRHSRRVPKKLIASCATANSFRPSALLALVLLFSCHAEPVGTAVVRLDGSSLYA